MQNVEKWLAEHRNVAYGILFLVLGVGAFFRLHDLGLAAFRADEGFFWDIFQRNLSAGDVVNRWLELQGLSGQFPFSPAFTTWFVGFWGLEVNHFSVRLPSALWGIVTMLAAYGFGAALRGRVFGLVLALILSLNPYHLQISREAYHYPPLLLGSFLGLWAAFWAFDHVRGGKALSKWFYAVNGFGFFLLCYSQPSGWPLAVLVSGTVVVCFGLDVWRKKKFGRQHGIILGTFLIIGLPLLVVPWGLKQMIEFTSSQNREHLLTIFRTGNQIPAFVGLWRVVSSFAWGDTALRGLFTVVVVALGLGVCLERLRQDNRMALLLGFMLAGFVMAMLSRQSSGMPFSSRYFVALLPLYLTFLTLGLVFSSEVLPGVWKRPNQSELWPAGTLTIAAVALWLAPAYACTQLTGKPTPYKLINSWVDANLPRGTLILVDRWFESWCEFKTEPATNVIYTYTVPDEPLQTFLQVRWRDTATNFFASYPDAAYCEMTKHYFEEPSVGYWEWPRQFFARHVAFTNEAGMKLRSLGLANREDYYAANTNRLIVELFYNTREDVLVRAQESKQDFVSFYGSGWGYTKTQDHRDWRVLEGQAVLDLYNLAQTTNQVNVFVTGIAVGAAKAIRVSTDQSYTLPANQIVKIQIGPLALPPGPAALEFSDSHWQKARVPFLVERVSIESVKPPGTGSN